MVGKILLVLVSFLIFPVGLGIGAWYFFRKKEKGLGGLFAGLGVLALILIIVIPGTDSTESVATQQSGTSTSVRSSTPIPVPTRVSLREILDLRDGNEVAADAAYIGKYVVMDGIIKEIHEKDLYIIPLGSDEWQAAGATCKFDKAQSPGLLKLRKGQTITITGVIKDIKDMFWNDLEIKPCKFN
jgi:hypothetical protein